MINRQSLERIDHAAAAALLRIARLFHHHGMLYQAISPYLKIVACFPDSESAPHAVEGLTSIARTLEAHCRLHAAMGLYDRLEEAAHLRRWDGQIADARCGAVTDVECCAIIDERCAGQRA
jgi:hypothetical protein